MAHARRSPAKLYLALVGALVLGCTERDADGDEPSATSIADDAEATQEDGSSSSGDAPTSDAEQLTQCVTASDCRLLDDCCTCAALGPDDESIACADACEQTACAAIEVSTASCVQGRCVLDKTAWCDVQPGSLPAGCPAGTLPTRDPNTGDATGACVPVAGCLVVPDCGYCQPDEFCQTIHDLPATTHCRPMELFPTCEGGLDCDCILAWAAIAPVYDWCVPPEHGGGCSPTSSHVAHCWSDDG